MEILHEVATLLDIDGNPTEDVNQAVYIRHITVYDDGSSEITDLIMGEDEGTDVDNS
jgi:hypothetical protein